jgi:hypothetical protein
LGLKAVAAGAEPTKLQQVKKCQGYKQGDQIRRILAYWAIVYFGHVFDNYITLQNYSSPGFSATFSHS